MVESIGAVNYVRYVTKIRSGVNYEAALLRERAYNEDKFLFNVSLKRVLAAHGKTFSDSWRYSSNYEEFVLDILLWENFNFLGFTEESKVVYRKIENNEILCIYFEEYISYLESRQEIKF